MRTSPSNNAITSKRIQQQRKDVSEARLRGCTSMPAEEIFSAFGSAPGGLTAEQAGERLEEHGRNIITIGIRNTTLHRLRNAVINPFNIVLFAIAVITYITDVLLSQEGGYLTIGIILVMVMLSSLVAFVQSQRSNAAAEKLSRMISNKADILRSGGTTELPIDEIVPGDVINLSAGDMIPADIRFLATKDAFLAQAALTGESQPVEKFGDAAVDSSGALTDLQNIGFMGSNMVSGSATAIVVATGNDTFFGSMAKSLSGDRAKNSFERGVDSVSRLLIRFMLVMVPVVFIINGATKGDWTDALLFAITMAVGLTPEMLPVIMTSTLAKGAVSMSRRAVIVKTLSAIQTFGEMDILCTDKTGTLTEDRIILEKYMNVLGEDDKGILRYAYLNSHYQTGLKNLLDVAIMNRARSVTMTRHWERYTRIDEIPFDFVRRRMSVVLRDEGGERLLITKGAVEEMLSICSSVEMNGGTLPLNDENRRKALQTYEKYNDDGLRMIAVARKTDAPDAETFGVKDERDMVLIGFVGFLDPPKESAGAAIEALKEHGVRVVILTGDTSGVASKVCRKVGVDVSHSLTGKDVEAMNEAELLSAARKCNLFAKISPSQKERVVKAFQALGHTVGYMGDGINDAPALYQSDVGISVDSAVDIAKETADIILLKKDLMVLEEGVVEGRKTFGNIMKYIKMATSGNFGNMFSVLIASVFLPFLPMLPIHILMQNLLCEFSQIGIPFDGVDAEYIKSPRKWDAASIRRFIFFMGPQSSFFDLACFAVLWWVIGANTIGMAPVFQCGWFVFGTVSQALVIHLIRTAKIPFFR
ncbi:MAG: magnesium-translocating P-type ATPase, partial [Planctomycetes bacterium]|nr:magnesium-translocating P-type ATPase [Planctomycetota bacterium]